MSNILTVVGNPTLATEGAGVLACALVDTTKTWKTGVKPPILKLYNNDPVISPAMKLIDFVESIFSGYAAVDLDDLACGFDPDEVPMIYSAQQSFVGGSPLTIPDSATGYYWTDADETVVIAAERFVNNFPVDQIGDTIQISPRLLIPGRQAS